MLFKCCIQYISKFGKLSSGHRTGKRSVFIPISRMGNGKECSGYHKIALISHASTFMLKIIQARLQHYMNWKLRDVQARFIKSRGTREQTTNIWWIIQKAREFQENICFIDYTKAFDCVDQYKLLKILKEIGMPDHFTCLLRNLYSGEEQQLVPDMEQWTGSKLERSMTRLYIVTLFI